jgi:hypothetical protein
MRSYQPLLMFRGNRLGGMSRTTNPSVPAEVANLLWEPPSKRAAEITSHVGPDHSQPRPFFLPVFTKVVEGVFSEVQHTCMAMRRPCVNGIIAVGEKV